jgi:antitoxin component YwqK of YwqJK toxin-antitoxin module
MFVDGKSHGVRLKWHPNGQKQAEDSIEYGDLNGPSRKWHDNGQLAEEMTMVNSQADGQARSWHPDGSQKAQVTLKTGEVIKQKFWEEGEKPTEAAALAKQEESPGE